MKISPIMYLLSVSETSHLRPLHMYFSPRFKKYLRGTLKTPILMSDNPLKISISIVDSQK